MGSERRIRRFIDHVLLDGRATGAEPLAAGLLDSLEIEQLVAYVEEEFGVAFSDEELVTENFTHVEALAALVDRKRREAS